MATGRQAFGGKTSGVTFNAILGCEPIPARQLKPEMPAKLEEIITKALEKNREVRYQHASELRADLTRLRRDAESGRIPFFSQSPTGAIAISVPECSRLREPS